MPTIIGHSLLGFGLFAFRPHTTDLLKTLMLTILCTCLPDLDVISFTFGIPYQSMWGHRGFSHSLIFAALLGMVISYFFYPDTRKTFIQFISWSVYFFICTASHGLLDAMTTGGKGVGFFIPFLETRYFFPFRPIPVSPLDLSAFYTSYGLEIILSEIKFIGFLTIILIVCGYFIRKLSSN